MFKLKDIAIATALAIAIVPAVAGADTIGTIDVSLTITNACVINGAAALQSNASTVGTIRFPDQPGIFGTVDAELIGARGSGTLSVLCSPGLSPKLTIGSGTHDAAGRRHACRSAARGHYTVAFSAGTSGVSRPWRSMKSGAGRALRYNIYRSDGTTIWDETTPLARPRRGRG